jgi:hypothetical protein
VEIGFGETITDSVQQSSSNLAPSPERERRHPRDNRPQLRMSPHNSPRSSLTSTQAIIDGATRGVPANPTPSSTSPSLPSNSHACPEELVRKKSEKRSRKRPSLTNGTSQVGRRSGSRCRRDGR